MEIKGPIFVGGSPTAGKSFVTEQLSEKIGLPTLGIDEYRDDVRELARKNPKKYPKFADLIDVTAEEFWQHRTPEDVMRHEIEEGKEIWPFIVKKIKSGFVGIIEGVSILPQLLHQEYGRHVRAVFLVDKDPTRIRQAVYGRGVWGDTNSYADWVKELETRWLPKHADYFIQESKKYGYPCIEVGDRNRVFDQVVLALKLD